MTPEQMRALANALDNVYRDDLYAAEVIDDGVQALKDVADRLDAAQRWLANADTLERGDFPYLPDLQDIIDGGHGRDCAGGTMMNVEEFFPCSCWRADL